MYVYITTGDVAVKVGEDFHNSIQAGTVHTFSGRKGSLTRISPFEVYDANNEKHKFAIAVDMSDVGNIIDENDVNKDVNLIPLVQLTLDAGKSKAAKARFIMHEGYHSGVSYDEVIERIMTATGHDRQLARATYKANHKKIGIPELY